MALTDRARKPSAAGTTSRLALAVLAALLAVAPPAIAQAPAPAAAIAGGVANRGLKSIPLTLRTGDGKSHRYRVELAATAAQQEIGLMHRRSMPRGQGMLFPANPPRVASFWMRDTLIPLDLIFIAPDRRVIAIGRGQPMSDALIDSGGVVGAILELNAGEAARIGLRPGDRADW